MAGSDNGTKNPVLTLKKNLQRTLRAGHPWVWADAVSGEAPLGAPVEIRDNKGALVALGVRESGAIGARIWSTEPGDRLPELFAKRLQTAAELRRRLFSDSSVTNAFRLVHGEGDRMPGVVIDVYGAAAVMRFDGEGIALHQDALVAAARAVLESLGVTSLMLATGRRDEKTLIDAFGKTPDEPFVVLENGMKLLVDLKNGQKTGLFLDQRDSRLSVRDLVGEGDHVLNLYGYTGGFSVSAGLAFPKPSRVTTVDIAPAAIELARQTWQLNGLPADAHKLHAQDVPVFLDNAARRGCRYDLVISDPPNFAPNEASVDKALESYEKLHSQCLALLKPGGIHFAASCSSHVHMPAFEETLHRAAARTKTKLQVLQRNRAPHDHPTLHAFPESDYLKVVVTRLV